MPARAMALIPRVQRSEASEVHLLPWTLALGLGESAAPCWPESG